MSVVWLIWSLVRGVGGKGVHGWSNKAVGNWLCGAMGTIGGFDFVWGGEMFDDGFVGYGWRGRIS